MASSITLPLTPEVKILGLSSEAGRAVFVYADGKRTDEQQKDERGRPVFRHKVLIQLSADGDAEEAAAVLDSETPLGVLTPVVLDSTARVTVRPADQYSLALRVSGSLAKKSAA